MADQQSGWFKGRHSSDQGGNCLYVRRREDGGVDLWESDDPEGRVIPVPPGSWAAFLASAKDGDFD